MNGSNVHILIVDDDNTISLNLKAFLSDEGYRVSVSKNGIDALEVLEAEHVDIGIVDLLMPKMNGEEFILKAREKHPEVSFLMITGSAEHKLPNSLREKGMTDDDFFVKPLVEMKNLVKAIQRLMM